MIHSDVLIEVFPYAVRGIVPVTDCFYLIRVTVVQDYYLFRERPCPAPGMYFPDGH